MSVREAAGSYHELRDKLRAKRQAATDGKWERYGYIGSSGLARVRVSRMKDRIGRHVYDDVPVNALDADFIAFAANSLTAALDAADAEIAKRDAEIERLHDLIDGPHGLQKQILTYTELQRHGPCDLYRDGIWIGEICGKSVCESLGATPRDTQPPVPKPPCRHVCLNCNRRLLTADEFDSGECEVCQSGFDQSRIFNG